MNTIEATTLAKGKVLSDSCSWVLVQSAP